MISLEVLIVLHIYECYVLNVFEKGTNETPTDLANQWMQACKIMQFYVTNLQIISMGQPTSFSSLKVNWLQSESVKR